MTDAAPKMDDQDRAGTIEKYRKGYAEYGYSPRPLAGKKGGKIFVLKSFSRSLRVMKNPFWTLGADLVI